MFCLSAKNLPLQKRLKAFPRSFQFTIYSDSVQLIADTIVFYNLSESALVSELFYCERPSFLPFINQTIHVSTILKNWDDYLTCECRRRELFIEGMNKEGDRKTLRLKVSNPRTDCANLIFDATVIQDEDSWDGFDELTDVSSRIGGITEDFILVDEEITPQYFILEETLSLMQEDEIEKVRHIVKQLIVSHS